MITVFNRKELIVTMANIRKQESTDRQFRDKSGLFIRI